MKQWILSLFMVLLVNSLCWSDQVSDEVLFAEIPKTREMSACKILADSAKELGLGFPFDDPGRMKYNGFTFAIAKRIHELKQSGLLSKERRPNVLNEIISVNWKRFGDRTVEGYTNYGALQEMTMEMDVANLFAAFVLASQNGDTEDIVPFLEFCTCYFGASGEAMPGVDHNSFAEDLYNQDLTKAQRNAFFPAELTIMKYPEKTVPLLIEALKNTEVKEWLRLRAAGYLNQLDREVLKSVENELEPEMRKKVDCIIESDSGGSGVTPFICENLERYKQMMKDK
ncbi:MAG: hypothetical protein GC154_21870 [bacterium]|nr:hypothetical protein [bacterium]